MTERRRRRRATSPAFPLEAVAGQTGPVIDSYADETTPADGYEPQQYDGAVRPALDLLVWDASALAGAA